jgi:hypothetical protein
MPVNVTLVVLTATVSLLLAACSPPSSSAVNYSDASPAPTTRSVTTPAASPTATAVAAAKKTPNPNSWDNPEFKDLLKPRTKQQEAEERAEHERQKTLHAYGGDQNLRILKVQW